MLRFAREHANRDPEHAVEEKCPTAEVLAHEVETYHQDHTTRHEPPKSERGEAWRGILGEIYGQAMNEIQSKELKASVEKWWEHLVRRLRKAEKKHRESFSNIRACETLLYLLNWFPEEERAQYVDQPGYTAGDNAHGGGMTEGKLNALRLQKMMVSSSPARTSVSQSDRLSFKPAKELLPSRARGRSDHRSGTKRSDIGLLQLCC